MVNKTAIKSILTNDWFIISLFAFIKLLIHLFTYDNFELHRDAYLYYAQSENLSWGYVAVPPSIAFFGKIATFLFGNTTFGLRFFPAVVGALNLLVIGLAVRELGGRWKAISLASLSFILSPSFLHVNALFQPVSFNQFYWLLSGYLILIMIKRNNPRIWILLGVVFGLAFLNKYSIVFFYTGFGLALLFTHYKSFYKSRYFLYAMFIGLLIISPNLIWQYQNNWPVLVHMAELRETQLVHVELSGFILGQFLMNMQAVFIWLAALLFVFFSKQESQYKIFGLIYIFVVLLLIFGSGKTYYTLGFYPFLFALGSYFIVKYLKKYSITVYTVLICHMIFSLYISQNFDGIPLSSFEAVKQENAFRWEDGKNYDIPQDMADMTGWKELALGVREVYQQLDETEQKNCHIFAHNYGQAGSVMFYNKDIEIPQPISFNGSFVFWNPDSLLHDNMIWVYSSLNKSFNPDSMLTQYFDFVELKKTINSPYFREDGSKIYLCQNPTAGGELHV